MLFAGLCTICIAQESAEPPDHGAYYKAKDGWQKLEILTTAGASAHAFSGVTISYRGAEAPVQLTDRRPVFYLKARPYQETQAAMAARNEVIILLEKKKDHRELQNIKSGLFSAKAEVDKKRLPDVTVRLVNDLTISITPNQDLAPGEYLLTNDSMGHVGYDFGIK